MSIFVTTLDLCGESEYDDPAPIVYRKSHVMPTLDDPRGGSLDLGEIPGYITVDGNCLAGKPCTRTDIAEDCCEYADGYTRWPFLRVSLRPSSLPTNAEWKALLDHAQGIRDTHGYCVACPDLGLADLIERHAAPEDTVILDRSQVEKLRDHLTDWLNRAVAS